MRTTAYAMVNRWLGPVSPPPTSAGTATVPVWKTSLWHAGRDTAGQIAAKTTGLLVFTGLSNFSAAVTPLKFVGGGIGALSAGTMAYLIAKKQIGTETTCQRAAVYLCTAAGGAAGAVVTTFGCWQITAGISLAGILTPVVSTLGKPCSGGGENPIEKVKANVFALSVVAGTVGGFALSSRWSLSDDTLPARNMGAAFESLIVELCKSSFEQVGLSVNRNVLTFEGKVLASALGMLPYVAASVYINGYLASLAQPSQDSHQFIELLTPVVLSTLVNGVRGASNSAAVRILHQQGIGTRDPDVNEVRAHHGLMSPNTKFVEQKTAVRFSLVVCRNAMYLKLREMGVPLLEANYATQFVYSLFAQNRDLMFDLMQGQGWTPRADSDASDSDEIVDGDSTGSSSTMNFSSSNSVSDSLSDSEEVAHSDSK